MKSSTIWKDAALKLLSLSSAFVISGSAFGSPTLSVRYQSERTAANTLGPGILNTFSLSEQFATEVGTALRFSHSGLEVWEYKGEGTYDFSPLVSLSARLARSTQFTHATGHTTLTGFLTARTPRLGGFEFWTSLGWYRRFSSLSGATVLPVVWGDYSTHDFAAVFAGRWSTENWALVGRVATFDEWETYNLNHPFLEARLEMNALAAFARYQLTLGFGRLDRFVAGVEFTVPLGDESLSPTR